MLPTTKTLRLAEKAGFSFEEKTCWEQTRASITDIQDWLREEHRIHCSVAPWKDETDLKHAVYFEGNVIDEDDDFYIMQIDSWSKDYYKCLESCVTFGIKILIDRNAEKEKKSGE